MSAAISLLAHVHAKLISDGELTALLGGPRVYDLVPSRVRPPYLTFGPSDHLDWSTSSEEGEEHAIVINAWSRKRGRKEALQIAAAVKTALADLRGQLGDQMLVNFTHEFTRGERDEEEGLFVARLNFRVVTEPIQSSS